MFLEKIVINNALCFCHHNNEFFIMLIITMTVMYTMLLMIITGIAAIAGSLTLS